MKLRTSLLLMVLGSVIPLIVLAVFLVAVLVESERESNRRGATDRIHAVMSAVDAELRGTIGAAQTLATSEDLRTGDFRAFLREALAVLASQPDWVLIIVTRPTGEQIINTSVPAGLAFPASLDPETIKQVAETRDFSIGNVVLGRGIKEPEIAVRVPIIIEGEARYVLSADIRLSPFQRLIDAQRLQEGSVMGLVDRTGRFIARRPQAPSPVASEAFMQYAKNAPEGWYRGLTVEGLDTFTAHVTSPLTGWSIGYALPIEQIYGPAIRATAVLIGSSVAVVALAFAFAFWTGRRIAAPVSALASWARILGGGAALAGKPLPAGVSDPVAAPPKSTIEELRTLEQALSESAEKLRAEFIKRDRAAAFDEAVMNNMVEGLYTLDEHGLVTSMNPAAEQLLGWSFAELRGKKMHDITHHHHPDGAPLAAEQCAGCQVLSHGRRLLHHEDVFIRKDGAPFPVTYSMSAMREASAKITGLVVVFNDITERKAAERERERAAEAMRMAELSRQMVAVQEEERRRLALDLHDRTSPNLAALALNLQAMAAEPSYWVLKSLNYRVDDMRALLEDAMAGIREIGVDLRPSSLDHGGLVPALESYAAQFARRTGIPVEVVGPQSTVEFENGIQSTLFRIVQEALTNAAMHAQAKSIRVELAVFGDRSVLSVADDGIGFDVGRVRQRGQIPGLGLIAMRERAEFAGGRFSIESHPGKGTRVSVEMQKRIQERASGIELRARRGRS